MTFIIEYTALAKNGDMLANGKIKAKNKISDFEAKCGLEEFLKRKYTNFGKLIVKKCEQDIFSVFDFFKIYDKTII